MTLVFAGTAFADTPTVNSFTADPQSISSHWGTTLSWDTSNSAGREILFNCSLGVTIKKDGTSFPCDMRQSISGDPVGSAGFMFTNVSGATQNITVTMYPKDSSGTNYDQGAVRLTLSVTTSPQPILDFSVSSTTIPSGAPITLSWTGIDASGVNVQFDCVDAIRIGTSASGTDTLPCGKPALATDLPISGTFIVYPTNSSRAPVSVRVHVFPAIGGGTYDATHSLAADFQVLGIPLPTSPSASSLTSSLARLMSDDSFTLSWATRNSAGANIKFTCQEGLTVSAVIASTSPLPCNTPAFMSPLGATGSTTLTVKNRNLYVVNLGILLLPQDASGIYFQTTSLSLSIPVFPVGTVSTPSSQTQSSSAVLPLHPTSASASVPPAKTNLPKYTFTRALQRGSKNADVTALQKVLAQYPDIYPEGLVTGFFGTATEKALGRFQDRYGVAKKGEAGYGTVGPKTRTKLNSM